MLRSVSHLFASTSGSGLQAAAASAGTASAEAFTPLIYGGLLTKRWATKKQGGSTKNKKDSNPKHLGAKMLGGQLIFPGQTIMRQRGTRWNPGHNVGMGRDHTLFATIVGFLKYRHEVVRRPGRATMERRIIDVLPLNGDWSEGYAAKQAAMVAARTEAKRELLGPRAKFYMRMGRNSSTRITLPA